MSQARHAQHSRIRQGATKAKGSQMQKPYCPIHKFDVPTNADKHCTVMQHWCARCKEYVDWTSTCRCPQCRADLSTARRGRCNEVLEQKTPG